MFFHPSIRELDPISFDRKIHFMAVLDLVHSDRSNIRSYLVSRSITQRSRLVTDSLGTFLGMMADCNA